MHPTSLPGPYGIGDLGPAAYRFVDWLAAAGQRWWQVLPLGPTGFGDSPYQCFSAFAGNPTLISPEALFADGLLGASDLRNAPEFSAERVDFAAVGAWKRPLLGRAADALRQSGSALRDEYESFRQQQASWLDDFSLFLALKEAHGAGTWSDWPQALATRQPAALAESRRHLGMACEEHAIGQFLFFRQWSALKRYAAERGVQFIGDLPIFVAYDSADAWARPELFFLDACGKPTFVAGVPPDYFSATGQLWGNPLYRWEVVAEQGYGWWIERMRTTLTQVDFVRIDHFIGFTRYWEIPAGEMTAVKGRYLPGPGADLLETLRHALGGLPLIAEDLGVVTPEVVALREQFELPGMKVLQFAFGADPTASFLPHRYTPNFVVYTGTHDNDTTVGWFATAPEHERHLARRYLGRHGDDIAWDLIRLGMSSVADTFVAPVQDLLALGTEARMNHPGRAAGNWSWRLQEGQLGERHAQRLRDLVEVYDRGARQV